MKFTLVTTRTYYNERERPALEALGFKFEGKSYEDGTKAVDEKHLPEVELTTIDELMELRKKVGGRLIIDRDVIEIYNGRHD